MTIIHAIILGIVQGLTEFLPISSSAHLNVFPWIFNWEMLSEGMDVALHIGTLLATKNFYFVPFGQDAPDAKPNSLTFDVEKIVPTIELALESKQIQPILK